MKKYEWRDRDESGDLRFFRAIHHGGAWTFRSQPKGEEEWTTLDPPPTAMLREFRERLWRKYQRRRASWEEIVQLDGLIEEAEEAEEASAGARAGDEDRQPEES